MINFYQKYILPKRLNSVMGSTEIEKLRPGVIGQASGVVLEIGIGPGHNLPFYKNISKLYAVEPIKELIALAQKRAESISFPIEFLNASAEHIPLADASVDTVVSTWTLCSIEKPEEALREVARVLRPGGRFVFIDHGISPKFFIRFLQRLSTPITKHFTGNCHLDRDIEKLIRRAGFEIHNLKNISKKFNPLIYHNSGVATL